MEIQQIFGANVRQYRQAKAWSQDDLSEASGLHRTYISGIERGVRNPTIEIVNEIAMALNVSAGALFENTNPSGKASLSKPKNKEVNRQ